MPLTQSSPTAAGGRRPQRIGRLNFRRRSQLRGRAAVGCSVLFAIGLEQRILLKNVAELLPAVRTEIKPDNIPTALTGRDLLHVCHAASHGTRQNHNVIAGLEWCSVESTANGANERPTSEHPDEIPQQRCWDETKCQEQPGLPVGNDGGERHPFREQDDDGSIHSTSAKKP